MIEEDFKMSKELYIVNTRTPHSFLNFAAGVHFLEENEKSHQNFIERVRTQHSGFDIPYLALYSSGGLVVPYDLSGGLMGCVVDEVVPFGGKDQRACSLDAFIDRLRSEGESTWHGQKPITAIVEFSSTELYPHVMENLAKKYGIKKIFI